MKTPAELIELFETGDKPNGQAFADLITSLRSRLETIPHGDVAGLQGFIEAIVDAKLAQIQLRQFGVFRHGSDVTITEGGAPVATIEQATDSAAGLLSAFDKAKLDALPEDAGRNKTTQELVDDLRGHSAGWLPASAVEGLIAPTLVTVPVIGSAIYELEADTMVYTFFVIPDRDGPVAIGTTPNGSDIVDTDGQLGERITVPFDELAINPTTLYFSGDYQVKFKIESYA